MCMLQWARGKTRLDHVRNVDIGKEYPKAEFLREKRLRWFAHVQRRDKDGPQERYYRWQYIESEIEADQSGDGETW